MSTSEVASAARPKHYPFLYQINTRTYLEALSERIGRAANLNDIPDEELDQWAAAGFDIAYFLGVWQTGTAGGAVSRSKPEWRPEFERTLPDLRDDDICGSPFAVTGYDVAPEFGGEKALEHLRDRLNRRGLRLVLDFVPNHTALDHPWVTQRPEYYLSASEDNLAREPHNYRLVEGRIMAHGRDPHFDGWPDTLQLNYGDSGVREAMASELRRVAERCDGMRCDMAMLVLPQVFERTWGVATEPFWPETIAQVKENNPDFFFIAEVYWGLARDLQQQGFDYTYDKDLYDHLVRGQAVDVREHLLVDGEFQERSVRFLENHDTPRVAAVLGIDKHRAAALITFLCPGLRFFHQGQLEGAKLRTPIHLCRKPPEPTDDELVAFYRALMGCLRNPAVRAGFWHVVDCLPAWEGNWTHECFVAQAWRGDEGTRLVAVVNYADNRSQCYLPLPFSDLADRRWLLRDLLSEAAYKREGDGLMSPGLYLDVDPWQFHLFQLLPSDETEEGSQ